MEALVTVIDKFTDEKKKTLLTSTYKELLGFADPSWVLQECEGVFRELLNEDGKSDDTGFWIKFSASIGLYLNSLRLGVPYYELNNVDAFQLEVLCSSKLPYEFIKAHWYRVKTQYNVFLAIGQLLFGRNVSVHGSHEARLGYELCNIGLPTWVDSEEDIQLLLQTADKLSSVEGLNLVDRGVCEKVVSYRLSSLAAAALTIVTQWHRCRCVDARTGNLFSMNDLPLDFWMVIKFESTYRFIPAIYLFTQLQFVQALVNQFPGSMIIERVKENILYFHWVYDHTALPDFDLPLVGYADPNFVYNALSKYKNIWGSGAQLADPEFCALHPELYLMHKFTEAEDANWSAVLHSGNTFGTLGAFAPWYNQYGAILYALMRAKYGKNFDRSYLRNCCSFSGKLNIQSAGKETNIDLGDLLQSKLKPVDVIPLLQSHLRIEKDNSVTLF